MSDQPFENYKPELAGESVEPGKPAEAPPNKVLQKAVWNDPMRPLQIVWLPAGEIKGAPRRLRRALETQTAEIKRAIELFGFRIPILVDGRHRVIDGHARLEAARLLGADTVPCLVVADLSETDIRRLALSLNKLQEAGQWDDQAVALEITEILEIDGSLEFPGFKGAEIEAIRFGVGDPEESDPADDLSEHEIGCVAVVTRPGDMWVLGDHRIICGNARDGDALAALLEGELADAVFTDVPYNVPISGHVSTVPNKHPEFAEASGEMSRDEYIAFLVEALGNAATVLRSGGVFYSCIDWRHVGEMREALEKAGLHIINMCVWVKSAPGMGGLYRSQHELIFVSRRPGATHTNNVQLGKYGRNRSNVWHYAGATGGKTEGDDDFTAHPTVKPIRLVMDALLDVTVPGDLVCDPFLGSGTTLLAAERTRRRCVGVEIEPRYVDLAIRRWQTMTGGAAIHAESGATFEETEPSVAEDGCCMDEESAIGPDASYGEDA